MQRSLAYVLIGIFRLVYPYFIPTGETDLFGSAFKWGLGNQKGGTKTKRHQTAGRYREEATFFPVFYFPL